MGHPALKQTGVTFEDYLALEAASEIRHELVNGEIFDMAGGTEIHALLAAEVVVLLRAALADRPCFVFGSDLRVRVAEATVFYPDVQVICRRAGEPEGPTVVVEVLSESTEVWDRTGKFAAYRTLPALRHYVLVRQDEEQVEHYRRNDDGSWRWTVHGPGEALTLDDLATVSIDALYERVRALKALTTG